MYRYDNYDRQMQQERIAQFRDQTRRFLSGELENAQFLPLRLQNGLYVQRLAPMFRIAVPYGCLSATQLRKLAYISRHFDKGYAHFSTRQNVQFNWPQLPEVPDILAHLLEVEMHANQTSGNCIRNTTTDQFAGVSPYEIEDSRPWCEIIRQWSTFHPEFAHLPRKFKIAVCGTEHDQAATQVHDIGLYIVRSSTGDVGFQVLVGGGLGRTPVIGSVIRDFLPWQHLLSYLEAIVRIYNQEGRRDNKYKARIKILVKELGADVFRDKVEAEWLHSKDGPATLTRAEFERCKAFFTEPPYETLTDVNAEVENLLKRDVMFSQWHERNVRAHKKPGYRIVTLCLKATGSAPGDLSAEQMEFVAGLADLYSFGELRVSHEQNLVLTDVRVSDLPALHKALKSENLATPYTGLLNDMISCPGGDFCSLANAKSIPIAEAIQRRFDNYDMLTRIGEMTLNISGCMNACGHHHVGNIGILGVDKKGEEFYQVTLGGAADRHAALGKVLGPSFAQDDIPDVIEKIIGFYLQKREGSERFIDTYNRLGIEPFKEHVYARLIDTSGTPQANGWALLPRDTSLETALASSSAQVLVNALLWREHQQALLQSGKKVAVWLDSDQGAELIGADLPQLALVALNFPEFKDGRSYSTAVALRKHHGYAGEIRAIGDVLRDQLFYMKRCGFTSFDLKDCVKLEDAQRAFSDYSATFLLLPALWKSLSRCFAAEAAPKEPQPLFRRLRGNV